MKFNLYLSAIRYASFFAEKNFSNVKVELIDKKLLKDKKRVDLQQSNLKELQSLTHMDFKKIFSESFQEELSFFCMKDVEKFITSDNFEYSISPSGYVQRNKKFPLDIIVQDKKIIGFQSSSRNLISILILDGYENETVLSGWQKLMDKKIRSVKEKETYLVKMKDGIRLSTDVYVPNSEENSYPCVLIRTPYDKTLGFENYIRYVQRGYAVVIQDVRGRGKSEGEWNPMYYETEDGDDTLNWIANQSWSNGNIGMTGGSYLGYVQWAAAVSSNPHLKAIVSEVTSGSSFVDIPRRGGCFCSGTLAWAFLVSKREMDLSIMNRKDWDEILETRPIQDVCKKALGYDIPFFQNWIEHNTDDDFWKKCDWKYKWNNQKIPALIISGWFDDNGMGTTQALDVTKDYPRGLRKVILGPWMHSGNANYDIHNFSLGVNAIRYDIDLIQFMWLEKYLKNIENNIDKGPTVEYYSLGSNKWKTADNWYVENSKESTLYLNKNNLLSFEKPLVEGLDSYIYDPDNPSHHIIDMCENEIEVPENYEEEEKRLDYVIYTTPKFETNTTITGDVDVEIYFGSSAPDTDIVVRICDVFPDGRSFKIADALLDLKYREGFDKMVFLEKEKKYLVKLRTTKFSNTFLKGHCLRLGITSSAINFIFPNSNTKDSFNSEKNEKAHNSIYFGKKYPSKLVFHQENE